MNSTISRFGLFALALHVCACGGSEAPEVSDPNVLASDSLIVAGAPREPLTEADLAGMSLGNLSVEIPWTMNVISRDPGPAAPRSFVEAIEVSGHEGFDRVLFQLSSDAPFAGYNVRIVDGGGVGQCGEEERTVGAQGDRVLMVALAPARAREEGRTGPPLGMRDYGHTRLQEGGIICENQLAVAWMSTLEEGTQVRVLEMRSPQRLVVDVR